MSVCVESIDRYFAEEHPQGQEIAIDNDDQLLENDYRLMIGMGKTFSRFGITFMLQCFYSELAHEPKLWVLEQSPTRNRF